MSEHLKSRLAQHRVARARLEWLQHFKSVCSPDVKDSDFLTDDEADAISGAFYGKLRSGVGLWSGEYHTDDPSEIFEVLQSVGERFHDERAVFLQTGLGAIEVSVRPVFAHAVDLWKPEKHDFCVVSRDLVSGLCAERNFWQGSGTRHDKPYFEIHAWGSFVPVGSAH